MKLVGATNAFIRRPFVMEGVIQGLIAGCLAISVMFAGFQYVIPHYVPQIGVMEWPYGRWYYLCGGMLLLSVFMGFWGSQWAARRFIKRTSISE
jgi:cell division transport system permease protein